MTAGTGLRFGELSALWVGDVDLKNDRVWINKAWKRDGEDGETETPGWLAKQIRPNHQMRGHHLGTPKTVKSRRTIAISDSVAEVLKKHVEAKTADDFVFVTRSEHPLHNADFYTRTCGRS